MIDGHKEYIDKQEETSSIKGKILLDDLMKSQYKKSAKVSCNFDDYSVKELAQEYLAAEDYSVLSQDVLNILAGN